MKLVIDFVKTQAIGGKVLVLFILQSAVFAVFKWRFSPGFKEFSNGMETLDLTNFYSVAYVQELFAATSEEGLRYYLHYFSTLDLIYPLIYSFAYALLVAFLLKKLQLADGKFQLLILLPFVSAFFDYCENGGMIFMILIQPDFSERTALFTRFSSMLKGGSGFVGGGVLILLALFLLWRTILANIKTTERS